MGVGLSIAGHGGEALTYIAYRFTITNGEHECD
jgi:hypothetical protein